MLDNDALAQIFAALKRGEKHVADKLLGDPNFDRYLKQSVRLAGYHETHMHYDEILQGARQYIASYVKYFDPTRENCARPTQWLQYTIRRGIYYAERHDPCGGNTFGVRSIDAKCEYDDRIRCKEVGDMFDDPHTELCKKEERLRVEKFIDRHMRAKKTKVYLKHMLLDGLNSGEIAEKEDVAINFVTASCSAALRTLRRTFKGAKQHEILSKVKL